MLHLGKVCHVYDRIKFGAEVLTVSPDSPDSLRKAKTETPCPLLSDEKEEVLLRYGVKNDWTPYKRGIPHPFIYIIDLAGMVRFVEVRQNYFFRIKMSTILDELHYHSKAVSVPTRCASRSSSCRNGNKKGRDWY
ncbi:MAG: redoxin domain-containing protein [Pyrinomonadaceae bacterium]